MSSFKKIKVLFLMLCVLSIVTACGGKSPEASPTPKADSPQQSAKQDPLTLKVYFRYAGAMTDEEFKELFADPVKKKYPHITMELVRFDKAINERELVVSGEFPDLIFTSSSYLNAFKELDLPLDLNTLSKGQALDVSKFEPEAIRQIQTYGTPKEILALPLSMNFSLLYYHKPLFDQVGVPYPKDGMTWDRVIELGRQLHKPGSGQNFFILDGGDVTQHGSALSLPVVDSKTGKATLTTDGWKKIVDIYKTIKTLPGNDLTKKGNSTFINDHTLAMFAGYSGPFVALARTDVDWDMATYPQFPQAPGKAMEIETHTLSVTKVSKHQQEALNVISLLTSKENQIEMTKKGRLSSLKDEEVQKQFATAFPNLKGKNVQAVFKLAPAPKAPMTLFDDIASEELKKAADKYVKSETDVNTILREAEESANQKIEAQKNASKK